MNTRPRSIGFTATRDDVFSVSRSGPHCESMCFATEKPGVYMNALKKDSERARIGARARALFRGTRDVQNSNHVRHRIFMVLGRLRLDYFQPSSGRRIQLAGAARAARVLDIVVRSKARRGRDLR